MDRSRFQRCVGPILVLAASLFTREAVAQPPAPHSPAPPTEEEQTEARERYARAMQLVEEARHDAALIEMQRAYSLNPSYRILYNLGQIQSHIGDCAAAIGSFERYLAEGGGEVAPARANEVAQEIAKCRPRVGSVEVLVKEEGAEVLVDDVVVGRGPFRKNILTNAGRHRFGASKRGVPPVARVLSVAGGDRLLLEIELPAAAVVPRPGPTPPAVSRPAAKAPDASATVQHNQGFNPAWITWPVTGVFAAGAIVSAVMARKNAGELSDLRDTADTTRQALDEKEAATFRAAALTDVLFGAAVIAGGFSLYFSLSARSSDAAPPAVAVAVDPNGIRVRGAF